jgi:hypothetical protein
MKYIIIFILFLLFSSTSCNKDTVFFGSWILRLQNNTSSEVRFTPSRAYPDTLLPVSAKDLGIASENGFGNWYFKSKKEFINSWASDTLAIFVLNSDTVSKYGLDAGWQTIRNNNLYLKRIEKTAAELENENWTITYP